MKGRRKDCEPANTCWCHSLCLGASCSDIFGTSNMAIFFYGSVASGLVSKEAVLWVSKFGIHISLESIILLNNILFLIHKHGCVLLLHYTIINHLIICNVIHLRDVIKCCPIQSINSKFLSSLSNNPVPIPPQKKHTANQIQLFHTTCYPCKGYSPFETLLHFFQSEYLSSKNSSVQYPPSLTMAAKFFPSECIWSPIPLLIDWEVSLYHDVLDHGFSADLLNELFPLGSCHKLYIFLRSLWLKYPGTSFGNYILMPCSLLVQTHSNCRWIWHKHHSSFCLSISWYLYCLSSIHCHLKLHWIRSSVLWNFQKMVCKILVFFSNTR